MTLDTSISSANTERMLHYSITCFLRVDYFQQNVTESLPHAQHST